jgi:Tol biopolymer transport system component
MNNDGSDQTRLTHQKFHQDLYPRFSPNGKKIVFATDRYYFTNCCFDLFEMNLDGSNVGPITSNLTVGGCPDIGNCLPPDWGPKP